MIGTPLYFAPEVLAKILSDGQNTTKLCAGPLASWSIGTMLYEVLTMCPFPFKEPVRNFSDDIERLYQDKQKRFNLLVGCLGMSTLHTCLHAVAVIGLISDC